MVSGDQPLGPDPFRLVSSYSTGCCTLRAIQRVIEPLLPAMDQPISHGREDQTAKQSKTRTSPPPQFMLPALDSTELQPTSNRSLLLCSLRSVRWVAKHPNPGPTQSRFAPHTDSPYPRARRQADPFLQPNSNEREALSQPGKSWNLRSKREAKATVCAHMPIVTMQRSQMRSSRLLNARLSKG